MPANGKGSPTHWRVRSPLHELARFAAWFSDYYGHR